MANAQTTVVPPVSPDPDQARRFLGALDSEGVFTFQTFPEREPTADCPPPRILHGTFDELAATLVDLNEKGCGIFVMINEGDLKGRKSENVRRVRSAFVDLDGSEIAPVLQASVPPNIVVESSPGRWHAYWTDVQVSLDDFKAVQRALAKKFNGDPQVSDLPRVMRLPGFVHQKGEPFVVRLESFAARGER